MDFNHFSLKTRSMTTAHKLKALPPKIDYTAMIKEIGVANRVLGNLGGLLAKIPNPLLLLSPLLTKEAVASSKIEGTQATLQEVLEYEAAIKSTEDNSKERDIREIINYRRAIRHAVKLLEKRPIGANFIKQLHAVLLDSVRGMNKDRGNFRKVPVFIGKPGATIEDALYIPPEASELDALISNWEKFVNSDDEPDVLVQAAIVHYQFEAIHPFLDGNGRLGRLLIPIVLYQKRVLPHPVLYVSEYFERKRDDYYALLRGIDRAGDWEPWIRYFLKSIIEQARDAQKRVNAMLELYKSVKDGLSGFHSRYAIALLDVIFEIPITSFGRIKTEVKVGSPQTIYKLLDKFQSEGILTEITGRKRNRIYVFDKLMQIIR